MNRRRFIGSLTVLSAGVLVPRSIFGATSLGRTGHIEALGIQLFSLPNLLEQDFDAALGLLAKIGYKSVEFYGPYPFSAPIAIERWAAVTPSLGFKGSGYFGQTVAETKALLNKHGLTAPSIHTDFETLRTRMEPLAEAARVIGNEYVILPSIPADRRKTLDDYRRVAEEFNKIGEDARRHGVKFAYHNHGYGLKEVDGKLPLKVLIEATDPSLVFLEMDLFWTAAGGIDPVALLDAYPNRYALLHVKDMSKAVRFSGDGGDSKQWIELFPYMTTAGDGVLNLAAILTKARQVGVKHFIVEQDRVADPEHALKRSFDHLAAL